MNPLVAADPRRIGRYVIVGRLGSGGMGTVYLGRSPSGRQVAVKTVHVHLADDPEFRARFAREVTAARRVNGFYTADVVDADADAQTPWMATRFIDGPSLTTRVREGGPLRADQVLALGAGVAEALVSIHGEGLVHRDLKPSNVLLAPGGPQVIDFGIAHLAEGETLSAQGEVVGTFEYISPEQSAGEPVTPASDVFSLGGLLHFAATGRPAFGSGRPWELVRRVHTVEPDLSGIADDRLRTLVADCLAKEPGRRPTPREVVERCTGTTGAVAPGPPGAPGSPGSPVPPVPPVGRSTVVAARTDDADLAPSPTGRRPGRRAVLAGGLLAAGAATGLGVTVARRSAASRPAAPRAVRVFVAHYDDVVEVRPAPDGASYATVESSRLLRIFETATGRLVREFAPAQTRMTALAWSPDGTTIAAAAQDLAVRLCDRGTGAVRRTLTGHRDWVSAIDWSPDGATLASAGYDQTFRTWTAATGDSPLTVAAHDDWLTSIRFTPDGSLLVTGGLDATVALWRVSDGSQVWQVRTARVGHPDEAPVDCVACSPDGRSVAAGSRDGRVRVWDRATAALTGTFTGHEGAVRSVAWSADGRTLLSAGDDGTARLWDAGGGVRQVLDDGRGGLPGALGDGPRPATAAFTRDGGSVLVAAAGTVRVRRAATGQVVSTRPPVPGTATCLDWSPDGATLASGGADGIVRLWARADGSPRGVFGGDLGYLNALAFSRDGRRLVQAGDDGIVRVRDGATGRSLLALSRPTTVLGTPLSTPALVYGVAFTTDGRQILSCGSGGLRWWDAVSGALVRTVTSVPDGQWATLAVSPDGGTVATGHQRGVVRLWGIQDGRPLRTLEGHRDWVNAVAWAPDGRMLASGGNDGFARLWDPAGGTPVRTLAPHPNAVVALAFAPSAPVLATGCLDGVVRLWDRSDGRLRHALTGHSGRVGALAWTPDGRLLASAGADGTIRFWDVAAATE